MTDTPHPPQDPPYGQPPTTPPQRPRWLMPVLIAAAVFVVLAGGVAAWAMTRTVAPATPTTTPTPKGIEVTGVMVLYGTAGANNDDVTCSGWQGYSDVDQGTQVVVTDPSGTIIATTRLGVGQLIGEGFSRECHFSWYVSVPRGLRSYGVEVSHRGRLQFTEAEMSGIVQLSLGP